MSILSELERLIGKHKKHHKKKHHAKRRPTRNRNGKFSRRKKR